MRQPPGAGTYDAVPYPGQPFAQTHPDRLATLAALFGLEAAPPAGCRLLEIGCGDGGNLLPMALGLPEATFVGLDSSTAAIARARDGAAEAGIRNVRFEDVAIEDFDVEPGAFDYVVAHGVFSWVPAPVRERLLALSRRALAERGIAYVSYNALPGARVPQTLRELLELHLVGIDDAAERIARARRLLALLSGDDGQATVLGPEAASLLGRSDALLFHDVLSPVNDAFFFHEFAALAAGHGLQYLAEANIIEMQDGFVPADLRRELLAGEDPLRREQLLDLLKVRRFRQTLLCREEVQLNRTLRVERVTRFAVSSPARVSVEDPDRPGRLTFEAPGGSRLTTDHEVVVTALRRVAGSWPMAVWASELLAGDDSPDAHAVLGEMLLRCFLGNVVHLHIHPPALSPRPSERPVASALARAQAGRQQAVTNLHHARVRLEEEPVRRLLALLDGSRDREALLAALGGDLDAQWLGARLEYFARAGLLVA